MKSEEKQLEEKLKELQAHYISFKRLIDAGLIIATTSFTKYLDAVQFDRKPDGSKWNIYISAQAEGWEI